MLTSEENKFIEYWEQNRVKQKRLVKQLFIGLPLGVLFGAMIFINFFSGWYKRAEMIINTESSIIPVVLVAIILIVIFISVFSVRHKWDINEQRYRELLSKKDDTAI
jgi:L-cystine uptake protein TcyP (sodium:dicarboxylate symporter family)